ncbi:hypothetical protein GCK72_004385 [Caenorhabditis remanei]|uniref:Uncharacterized protein n=1 Tax=Caenorhabditis remanei TaxID=31234 RepID=A0A6A5HBA8_CAERE|nr:hypothetical protein GCK72_004385 [Caenorhabditis remanei]KAF1764437.1 hypothetical protein GCK72_004385 [Caenorhabditis remanei]
MVTFFTDMIELRLPNIVEISIFIATNRFLFQLNPVGERWFCVIAAMLERFQSARYSGYEGTVGNSSCSVYSQRSAKIFLSPLNSWTRRRSLLSVSFCEFLKISILKSTSPGSTVLIPGEIYSFHLYPSSTYNNRRDNRIPPYTPWIQFTTRSPKGSTTQRVAYNKYLYEATKTVHTKLFGSQAGTILNIENLEVTNWNSRAYERFKQIVHPSSLPIQQLKISSTTIPFFDCRHIIAREAKSLIIDNNPLEDDSWTPILPNLTNQRVCLMNENKHVPPHNDLIEDWLERGRPVGTTFSMGLKNEYTAKQCLDTLKQRENVLGSSEKQVQLRINASLILNVSYDMIDHTSSYPSEYDSNLWLRLKVIRRRSG